MLSWIKQLVEAFGLPAILTLFAAFLLWLRWRTVGEVLKDPNDIRFEAYREQLGKSRWTTLYHQSLKRWLISPLTRWFQEDDGPVNNPDSLLSKSFIAWPWTQKSYEFCLGLALIYPISLLFGLWVIFGTSTQLGQWLLLSELEPSKRMALIGGIAAVLVAIFLASRSNGLSGWIYYIFSISISLFFAVAVAYGAISVFVVTFVIIVAFAVGINIYRDCNAPSAVIITTAIAISFAHLELDNKLGFIAIALIVLAKLFDLAIGVVRRKPLSPKWLLVLYFGYSASLLVLINIPVSLLNLDDFQVVVLLFLAVLPLLNAFWDWLSLGISWGLLSAIASGQQAGWYALLWALLDLTLAVVFLIAISLTVTAGLAFYNNVALASGHEAVVDLGVLFSGIREDPANRSHFWVYAMFLSTLIPTFIHAVAASAAGIQAVSEFSPLKKWRQKAAAQLERDAVGRAGAQMYLTFVPLLAIAVPIGFIYLLYLIIPAHGAPFGWWLLDISEATARWVGGISAEE